LFDILGPRVTGASFLDLFAGTGAVGVEAASRGARLVVLVERNRAALAAIEVNVEPVRGRCRVLAESAAAALRRLAAEGERFDFVFLDPPYKDATEALSLADAASEAIMADGGVLILEHGREHPAPETARRLTQTDERRYGGALLTFYGKDHESGEKSGLSG
jgi:16S rRNA (guanine(966)-N(2))-methyltransferase RsmD